MVIKSPSGYRLIVRGQGRPKFPPKSGITWSPQFISQGSIIAGRRRIFINYTLLDGRLWQYKHELAPTAQSDASYLALKSASGLPWIPFIRGEFYNWTVPPTVVDKYPLD